VHQQAQADHDVQLRIVLAPLHCRVDGSPTLGFHCSALPSPVMRWLMRPASMRNSAPLSSPSSRARSHGCESVIDVVHDLGRRIGPDRRAGGHAAQVSALLHAQEQGLGQEVPGGLVLRVAGRRVLATVARLRRWPAASIRGAPHAHATAHGESVDEESASEELVGCRGPGAVLRGGTRVLVPSRP
jgi:hypothetical protein